MSRILVVEDNDAVAMGLQYGLEKEGFTVDRVANSADSHPLAQHADLFILDVRLPDGDGFSLCRQLRADGHTQPILMLTARDETIDKIIGLEVGADDYMTKPFELRELIARIRALLRRSYGSLAGSSPNKIQVGDLTIELTSQRVMRGNEELHLTSTEFKLLAFMVQTPNRPHSREDLLRELWGYDDYVGDPRTVDVHIRNLRQKVELDASQPDLVVTVRGAGYKFVME